ncbi:MAG: WecB/TagA/CpsF family glycosyltransferase [Candidatus Levybacteria bacterium]|nr:WecB/TagA/CpsF family glycosyltransferase [Candidatus Levybacteria bacterium]
MLSKKNILNVGITDASKEEILEYIIKGLAQNGKKYFVVTPNPEILVMADKNIDYQKVLNKAEIALADGIGVIIVGQVLGKPLKERVTGVDLLESLCLLVAEKPITVGFLGGKPGVAEKTAECLLSRYPNLKIGFVGQEWDNAGFVLADERRKARNNTQKGAERNNSALFSVFDQRGSAMIDILFVAFGAPKQELWMNENLAKIPVKVAVGVGGSFDYISGEVPRPPKWISKIGLEWFFRLITQPWRWKRQLTLLEFIYLVLKERFLSK